MPYQRRPSIYGRRTADTLHHFSFHFICKRTKTFHDEPKRFTFHTISLDPQTNMALNVIQKDQDSPKLFIGHIPRHYTETEMRPLLEEFGELAELALLRDKLTQASRC